MIYWCRLDRDISETCDCIGHPAGCFGKVHYGRTGLGYMALQQMYNTLCASYPLGATYIMYREHPHGGMKRPFGDEAQLRMVSPPSSTGYHWKSYVT